MTNLNDYFGWIEEESTAETGYGCQDEHIDFGGQPVAGGLPVQVDCEDYEEYRSSLVAAGERLIPEIEDSMWQGRPVTNFEMHCCNVAFTYGYDAIMERWCKSFLKWLGVEDE